MTCRDRKSRSDNMSGESEPEEGEITESDGGNEPSSSSSATSPVQPAHDSPERELEMQIQEEGEEAHSEGSERYSPGWLFVSYWLFVDAVLNRMCIR